MPHFNPGVTLPHHAIIQVHRGEGSNTFVFTQFLTFSTSSWEDDKGYGTTIELARRAGRPGCVGNDGMVGAVQATPYSIGYVGVSFSDAIRRRRSSVLRGAEEQCRVVCACRPRRASPPAPRQLGPRTPPG